MHRKPHWGFELWAVPIADDIVYVISCFEIDFKFVQHQMTLHSVQWPAMIRLDLGQTYLTFPSHSVDSYIIMGRPLACRSYWPNWGIRTSTMPSKGWGRMSSWKTTTLSVRGSSGESWKSVEEIRTWHVSTAHSRRRYSRAIWFRVVQYCSLFESVAVSKLNSILTSFSVKSTSQLVNRVYNLLYCELFNVVLISGKFNVHYLISFGNYVCIIIC